MSHSVMGYRLHDFEIVWRVVASVSVQMMHLLVRLNGPPKHCGCN